MLERTLSSPRQLNLETNSNVIDDTTIMSIQGFFQHKWKERNETFQSVSDFQEAAMKVQAMCQTHEKSDTLRNLMKTRGKRKLEWRLSVSCAGHLVFLFFLKQDEKKKKRKMQRTGLIHGPLFFFN